MASTEESKFPDTRLKRALKDSSRKPLVLVACGSFSPITYLHLRMFEMASDFVRLHTDFEVVGCYLSPVSDAYKKDGLARAQDRLAMCELALEDSSLLMVDSWEALKPAYTPTAQVLDHLSHEINVVRNGIETSPGHRVPAQISLLAGADLLSTFLNPGIWAEPDMKYILSRYGAFIIERSGTELGETISKLKVNLSLPVEKIWTVKQGIRNDVSSTMIREFLGKGLSARYLVPDRVLTYIEEHGLYKREDGKKQEDTGLTGFAKE